MSVVAVTPLIGAACMAGGLVGREVADILLERSKGASFPLGCKCKSWDGGTAPVAAVRGGRRGV